MFIYIALILFVIRLFIKTRMLRATELSRTHSHTHTLSLTIAHSHTRSHTLSHTHLTSFLTVAQFYLAWAEPWGTVSANGMVGVALCVCVRVCGSTHMSTNSVRGLIDLVTFGISLFY